MPLLYLIILILILLSLPLFCFLRAVFHLMRIAAALLSVLEEFTASGVDAGSLPDFLRTTTLQELIEAAGRVKEKGDNEVIH